VFRVLVSLDASGLPVTLAYQPRWCSTTGVASLLRLAPVLLLQFEPAQVSRFLVSLGASGLPVTLALNKADLLPAQEIQARIDQVRSDTG
jgi:hypothetical protein